MNREAANTDEALNCVKLMLSRCNTQQWVTLRIVAQASWRADVKRRFITVSRLSLEVLTIHPSNSKLSKLATGLSNKLTSQGWHNISKKLVRETKIRYRVHQHSSNHFCVDWCERALTIEGLWVTLVVVHPVLAVRDFIEVPTGGQ